jgi:hypothetical protein
MQTKKVVFFVLLATVLLSVSQAMIASVNASPVNDKKDGFRDLQKSTHPDIPHGTSSYCTQYLDLNNPQDFMLYNQLLNRQATANSTSLCLP